MKEIGGLFLFSDTSIELPTTYLFLLLLSLNVIFSGRGVSLTRGRNSFAGDQDDHDMDSMGEPRQAFCEYSFRCMHTENPIRRVCIQIIMNP